MDGIRGKGQGPVGAWRRRGGGSRSEGAGRDLLGEVRERSAAPDPGGRAETRSWEEWNLAKGNGGGSICELKCKTYNPLGAFLALGCGRDGAASRLLTHFRDGGESTEGGGSFRLQWGWRLSRIWVELDARPVSLMGCLAKICSGVGAL